MRREYRTIEGPCDLERLGREGWVLAAVDPQGRRIFHRDEPHPMERFTLEQREAHFARQASGAPSPGAVKSKLLNPDLAAMVRRVGHTQMLLIADMGFPMPVGPVTLDLSLTAGVPTIPQVLDAIGTDFAFDRVIAASEMLQASPARDAELRRLFPGLLHERPPHLDFKHLAALAHSAVRTGDATPYGNIIIVGA